MPFSWDVLRIQLSAALAPDCRNLPLTCPYSVKLSIAFLVGSSLCYSAVGACSRGECDGRSNGDVPDAGVVDVIYRNLLYLHFLTVSYLALTSRIAPVSM